MAKPQAKKRPAKARQRSSAKDAIVVALNDLPAAREVWNHGEKFSGGLGPVDIVWTDYWALRARSAELFARNLYARGLIRRLISNEINTGLHLEATPEEKILGKAEDSLSEWTEDVENRFGIWGKNPYLCDFDERRTFGALQEEARAEALIAGDVLVLLRTDPRTRLPRVQLIPGSAVQTPWRDVRRGLEIVHGVEIDALRRQVAYWVVQKDGSHKRLPAYGEKSGRRIAWLIYGTDRRLDDVRGQPLLSLVIQSLKEIDRFRDSTQRKAVINSMLAMFVLKGQERAGTRSVTGGGAIKRGREKTTDNSGKERTFRTAEHIPGLVLDELQYGEEPKAFTTNNTIENFGVFEQAILQSIAWANGVPPEILTLSFTNNYSASQAATNEFKMTLNVVRTRFGETFCSPIYEEWLLAQTLMGRIEAPGLLEAFRASDQFDAYGAWISADWSGAIKPAIDMGRLVRAYKDMVAEGFITRDRATRELTGTKYSKNIQKIARENKQLADAMRPLLELEAELANGPQTPETMRARKALSKTLKRAEKAISLCG